MALLGVTSQLLLGCAHMRPRPVLGWRRARMWGAVSCSGDWRSVTILTLQVVFLQHPSKYLNTAKVGFLLA